MGVGKENTEMSLLNPPPLRQPPTGNGLGDSHQVPPRPIPHQGKTRACARQQSTRGP